MEVGLAVAVVAAGVGVVAGWVWVLVLAFREQGWRSVRLLWWPSWFGYAQRNRKALVPMVMYVGSIVVLLAAMWGLSRVA
jgi:hypothetical protein